MLAVDAAGRDVVVADGAAADVAGNVTSNAEDEPNADAQPQPAVRNEDATVGPGGVGGGRLHFAADVQQAIERVLQSRDPLDAADFDATAYINQLFPTEQSLATIDDTIQRMELDICACDTHIRRVVRDQAATADSGGKAVDPSSSSSSSTNTTTTTDGHAALAAAQLVIGALCAQIGDIKRRAEHTEDTVRQITRDIKQLDCAKRNLTAAITTLNHLHMLVAGVESLVRLVERRQYAELVGPLQAITEVNAHFGPYVGRIAQIAELSARVERIHRELAVQIAADFRTAFGGGGAAGQKEREGVGRLTATQLADACKVVAVLDGRVRRDLLKWFIALQLEEYAQLFHENQDIAWLDRIDKRYAWLKRHLLDFEDRHGRIFPADWEVSERIAVRFCQQTRDQLQQVVARRRTEVDVKLLLFAIAKTAAFEVLLAKRFAGNTLLESAGGVAERSPAAIKPPPTQPHSTASSNASTTVVAVASDAAEPPPSPFHDLIGSCFKPYLDIYTDSIDRSLADILERFVLDARTANASSTAATSVVTSAAASGTEGGTGLSDSPVYPSCADLFVFYKKCMVQCAQLSCGQPLLDLAAIFKRYLREYAVRLLEPRLHSASAAGGGGGTGTTACSAFAGSGGSSASTFGAIASSAAAAATSSTKDHLQQLTATAGNVLHQLLKEKEKDASGGGASNNSAAAAASSADHEAAIAGRYTRADLRRLCAVLATAEYCLETVQQLEDKLREKIEPALRDRVQLGDERDAFHRLIAQCIQLMVADLVAGCDVALAAMVRIQWQQVNTVGDQSPYVSQLAATLRHTVPHVRDNLAASRKYYTQFCLKFVTAFMPKFVAALYRCRPATTGVTHASNAAPVPAPSNTSSANDATGPLAAAAGHLDASSADAAAAASAASDAAVHNQTANIMGCEQLLLDTHSIKTILLELPSIGSQVRRKAPASYTKVVLRGMAQPEAIVKLCMAPIGGAHVAYAEQYARMLPGSTVAEFGRVLEMKAVVRRADQAPLVEAWRRVTATAAAAAARQQQQQFGSAGGVSQTGEEAGDGAAGGGLDDDYDDGPPQQQQQQPAVTEMGHMRKLEAMIKKRLPN